MKLRSHLIWHTDMFTQRAHSSARRCEFQGHDAREPTDNARCPGAFYTMPNDRAIVAAADLMQSMCVRARRGRFGGGCRWTAKDGGVIVPKVEVAGSSPFPVPKKLNSISERLS